METVQVIGKYKYPYSISISKNWLEAGTIISLSGERFAVKKNSNRNIIKVFFQYITFGIYQAPSRYVIEKLIK